MAIIIAPNWRDYAEKYLASCLTSLRASELPVGSQLFLVDNESTEASFNLLKSLAPEAQIWRNQNNDGFCKGNNDAIRLALAQGFDYLVLLNMDTEVAPDWLTQLLVAAEQAKNWGAIQSRLMLFDDKTKVNSLGNSLHYLGFGFSAGGGQSLPVNFPTSGVMPISYFSGAALLIKPEVLKQVGLFDEKFWMYHDDLDLSWRLHLAGYQLYLAPASVVYHKYQFVKSIKQYFWLERNRLIFFLTAYELATTLVFLPMWFILEVGLLLYAIKNGFWREKIKSWAWFFHRENWQYLKEKKAANAKLRRVSDEALAKYWVSEIKFQEVANPVLDKFGNPLMRDYLWLAEKILKFKNLRPEADQSLDEKIKI